MSTKISHYHLVFIFEHFIRHLRTGLGGLLRMNPAFKNHGLKDLLPSKIQDPDEGCTRLNPSQYCFDAGTYTCSLH